MLEHPAVTAAAAAADGNSPSEPPVPRQRSLARAARHDILRRLAPALRHDMVVHLQSLGMMAEALSARLERGALPADDVQGAVSKLNRLSRQAVATSLKVSTWMEPGEDDTVALAEGVAECVDLLASSLNFRGYQLRNEAGDGSMDVPRGGLRFLLAGAILTLADAADGPGDVVVHTETSATHAVVAVQYVAQPERSFPSLQAPGLAPLAWPELQALAAEEGVELQRRGETIVLRLPRAVVTSPLKMAPV